MAVGAAVGAAAKALAAAAGKTAGRAAAARAAKRTGGGIWMGVVAMAAALVLLVAAVPAILVALAASAFASSQGEEPESPGGPGGSFSGSVIPVCAVLREVGEVDGTTANGSWSAEQLGNARTIIQVGMELDWELLHGEGPLQRPQLPPAPGDDWPTSEMPGVPSRAVQIALMTAMQESSLVNLDHDDDAQNPDGSIADGGGLFQQQVSQGWGTWEQVTDPAWATGAFLYALGGIEGWAEMDPWEAAHRTQGNRYASDYQRWWEDGDAGDLLSRFLDMSECATLPVDPPYYMTSGWGPRDTGIPGASRWHPAWDFDPGACGQPVYAMRPGEVVMVGGGAANNLGIVDPDSGAQLQYLHMPPGGELVGLGDQVDAGEQIGVIGDYGVGGCHLDLRIYAPRVLGESRITDDLTHTEDLTDEAQSGYVHPNEYAGLFGLDLCAPENCTNLVE